MTDLPDIVARAATALGLDAGRLRRLGGASGSSWDTGEFVLRVGRPAAIDTELVAAAAAATVVPVPRVIERADFAAGSAVLLEQLPGRPAADLALDRPDTARSAGRACGSVHGRLARVPAPAGLRPPPSGLRPPPSGLRPPPSGLRPAAGMPEGAGDRSGARLLHLDLHPYNLLVNGDGTLAGVLDWANAAAGPPVLDRARTWAILTLDPAARARHAAPGWSELVAGWTERAALDEVPPGARAWACRFMLSDLARRYSPAELEHVRQAEAEAQAAEVS
jgi:Ser/Thr protein kinase RdoA (MazF antagonist)